MSAAPSSQTPMSSQTANASGGAFSGILMGIVLAALIVPAVWIIAMMFLAATPAASPGPATLDSRLSPDVVAPDEQPMSDRHLDGERASP
ncbi:MAG TPA: hypothetical protein VGE52_09200 [Pirellulales bacterium]